MKKIDRVIEVHVPTGVIELRVKAKQPADDPTSRLKPAAYEIGMALRNAGHEVYLFDADSAFRTAAQKPAQILFSVAVVEVLPNQMSTKEKTVIVENSPAPVALFLTKLARRRWHAELIVAGRPGILEATREAGQAALDAVLATAGLTVTDVSDFRQHS